MKLILPLSALIKQNTDLVYVTAIWLFSRLVITITLLLIAPQLYSWELQPVIPGFIPTATWEMFAHWDGGWYKKIATIGYDYARDSQQHSIVFFPLYPLLVRGVMLVGLPFEVAGTLVSNVAFLGALIVLYNWVKQQQGVSVAKWATVVLALCPLTLFATVTYTEGLFLFFSTLALQAFDRRQYVRAAFWGAMTTAIRFIGIALVPAFILVAWRERRPAIAYISGFAATGGLFLFILYCAVRFGTLLAFIRAQQGWTQQNWFNIFTDFLVLNKDWNTSIIALTKIVMFFGGWYLLWNLRTKLSRVTVAYGFCSLAILLASSAGNSINRYTYAIVSLSICLGILLDRYPAWGYLTLCLFTVLLVHFTIRFAWWLWVA